MAGATDGRSQARTRHAHFIMLHHCRKAQRMGIEAVMDAHTHARRRGSRLDPPHTQCAMATRPDAHCSENEPSAVLLCHLQGSQVYRAGKDVLAKLTLIAAMARPAPLHFLNCR